MAYRLPLDIPLTCLLKRQTTLTSNYKVLRALTGLDSMVGCILSFKISYIASVVIPLGDVRRVED
jgi:hypothetical protein